MSLNREAVRAQISMACERLQRLQQMLKGSYLLQLIERIENCHQGTEILANILEAFEALLNQLKKQTNKPDQTTQELQEL